VFSWKNPPRVESPFVDYWYTYSAQDYYQGTFHQSFDWFTFIAVNAGGLALIWLTTVGVVWAVRGIRAPTGSLLPIAGSQQAAVDNSP
jgi:hypothetical protein